MSETKAARCEGDVRKLTHFFETLGTSSPVTRKNSEIINQKGSAGSGTAKSRELVAGGGASLDKRQFVPCNQCFKSHGSPCPFIDRPCYICYKVHRTPLCPYLDHLPRGAKFNPGYKISCACGNLFNEDKWACTSCGMNWPVLKAKYCSICNVYYQHSEYECQKDKVLAAQYKSIRDEMLSNVPVPCGSPYPESSYEDMEEGEGSIHIPESSSGVTYSPTAPSWVCEDMNMSTPCWKVTKRTI